MKKQDFAVLGDLLINYVHEKKEKAGLGVDLFVGGAATISFSDLDGNETTFADFNDAVVFLSESTQAGNNAKKRAELVRLIDDAAKQIETLNVAITGARFQIDTIDGVDHTPPHLIRP